MTRRGVGALAASPTLVGAITTPDRDPRGLPRLQRQQRPAVRAELPGLRARCRTRRRCSRATTCGSAACGLDSSSRWSRCRTSRPAPSTRRSDLKLDKNVDPLPKDSTVIVRAKSALGLKYLEIDKGTSDQGYPEGSILPLSAAHPHPVEIDQVLNTFDPATRHAIQANLVAFGDALAGPRAGPERGARRAPAAGQPSSSPSPATWPLRRRASPASSTPLRPTAPPRWRRSPRPRRSCSSHLDSTFGAFARVARPFIQETISETPPTLDTLTRTGPRIQSFLGHSATLFADLRPGIKSLSETSPEVASALETGAKVLPGAPALNDQLAADREDALRLRHRTRASRAASSARRSSSTPSRRRCEFVTPGADGLQLRVAPAPQRPEPAQPRRRGRDLAAVPDSWAAGRSARSRRARTRRTARTAPPRHRPTARRIASRRTSSTSTRIRTPPRPGQPHVCAAGNEKYIPNKVVIGNPPLLQTKTDATSTLGSDMSLLRRKRGPVKRDPTKAGPDERIFGRHYRGPSPGCIGLVVALVSRAASTSRSPSTSRSRATATSSTPRSRTPPP